MSTHEPGPQTVTISLNGVPVSTLNPLPTTGGGGGGGGMVTQGAGSGLPTGAWTTRLSNGTAFYNALTDTELRASPVAVSASSLPLPTGAATEVTLAAASASLTSIDGKLASPMPVTGPLTDMQLRASAVAVTGPLTDAQLRAAAVPISAASLPLPTGAATEATLASVDANLTDIQTQQTDGTQRTRITDGTANDVAVSNAAPVGTEYGLLVRQIGSAALPTGAATAANQTTEIASLASIDSKLTGVATAANQTNGTQLTQISNGTNSASVLNTTPAGTEYGLLVRTIGSTSAAITSIPYSGLTAAAVPVQAAYVGGTDANGLLRGFAANADNDANPSSGKMVTMPAVTKNTTPTWQNNKVVPLWVDTTSALLMTSAAQGSAAATANAWPFKLTDGTNSTTLLNSAPVGTEYGLPVRPTVTRASTSSVTSPTVTSAFAPVLAANSNAKLRIFYNPNAVPVGLTLGGTGAVAPGFVLAPGQTWIMPQGPDGIVVWPGVVNATVAVGTASINITEIV